MDTKWKEKSSLLMASIAQDLDVELEKAQGTLKDVDDRIKKVFGKESVEFSQHGVIRRLPPQVGRDRDRVRGAGAGGGRDDDRDRSRKRKGNDDDGPNEKWRRLTDREPRDRYWFGGGGTCDPRVDFNSRDGGRNNQFSKGFREPMKLKSTIVNTVQEKSRDEVLAEQRRDSKGSDRNKRMFGALLGTLQKFKQDESKVKEQEEKRAQIEAKLDETLTKEKEDVKKKKILLIKDRKMKETEVKILEYKRRRIVELAQWEEKTKHLANFIKTDSKPSIFYLPKKMNPITECKLEQSKQFVAELISKQRKLVIDDIEDFEKRIKRDLEDQLDDKDSSKNNNEESKDSEEELIEKDRIEGVDGQIENNDEKENGDKINVTNIRITVENNNNLKPKPKVNKEEKEEGEETGSESDEQNSASGDEEPGPSGDPVDV